MLEESSIETQKVTSSRRESSNQFTDKESKISASGVSGIQNSNIRKKVNGIYYK
jgi:hypothetical protein